MESSVKYLDSNRVTAAMQTLRVPVNRSVSGYGGKLPTSYMVQLDGKRWHRMYCMCYGNSGSCYVVCNGEILFTGRAESRIEELARFAAAVRHMN